MVAIVVQEKVNGHTRYKDQVGKGDQRVCSIET
jgi:hypothetical protein